MKRILSISAIALAMFALCASVVSCGPKRGGKLVEKTEKSQAQIQQEQLIMMQLDTLSSDFSKLKSLGVIGSVKDGKIVLSDQEKQLKPEYLADASFVNNLQTLAQKYRAISILACDRDIAELYEMPVDEYNKALVKLYADINDSNLKNVVDSPDYLTALKDYYNLSKDNGRLDFFWDAAAAGVVEELYILSQNQEKFLASFDDESASNVSYHIALLSIAIEDLATINPEYAELNESLKPLIYINAINLQQLREQLDSQRESITASREALLK